MKSGITKAACANFNGKSEKPLLKHKIKGQHHGGAKAKVMGNHPATPILPLTWSKCSLCTSGTVDQRI